MSKPEPALLVLCLCAQWCGVCGDYRARFEQVGAQFAQAQFLWIDVEDEADLLHPLDVENFPTVLLAAKDGVRFFGTITPQASTLERLVRSAFESDASSLPVDPVLTSLVARIRAAKGLGA